MPETLKARVPYKSGTAASWASFNPILLAGEPGYETDTKILRIGDGSTAFVSLPAIDASGATPAPASRIISTGTGLTGGGDLSTNRSLALTGQALALHNLATAGLVTRTGVAAFAARSVAGTANQIAVTNANGVAGNPTLALVLPTQIEAEAGTDANKPMPSLRVRQAIDARAMPLEPGYASAMTLVTPSNTHTFFHGLGVVPRLVEVRLVCISADTGFGIGTHILVATHQDSSSNGLTIWTNTGNVGVQTAAYYPVFSPFGYAYLDLSKWNLLVRAWA